MAAVAARGPNLKPLLWAILVVLAIIAVVLMSSSPWESDAYKRCVAEQKIQAGGSSKVNSYLENAIEQYCHDNFD